MIARAITTFNDTAFMLDAEDRTRVRFFPWGDLDFLCLMPNAENDGPSPEIETMRVEGEALVFETPLGRYRLTGDVREIESVTIRGPYGEAS